MTSDQKLKTFADQAIFFLKNKNFLQEIKFLKVRYKELRKIMPSGHPGDMPWCDWLATFSICKAFKPDIIIEFGRGYGNSTLIFDFLLKDEANFISICNTDYKEICKKLHLKKIFLKKKTQIITQDIKNFPFEKRKRFFSKKRSLIFWDAHGFDVAEVIFSKVLGLFEEETLVLVHDISDIRYQKSKIQYGKESIWKGLSETWPGPSVVIGKLVSNAAQIVTISDFCFRNNIIFNSLTHYFQEAVSSLPRNNKKNLFKTGFKTKNNFGCFLFKKNNKTTFPARVAESKPIYDTKPLNKKASEVPDLDLLPKRSLWNKIFALRAKIRPAHNEH